VRARTLRFEVETRGTYVAEIHGVLANDEFFS
jgi:hypothetical protein